MKYIVERSYKITFTKSSGFTYNIVSSKASVTTIVNHTGTIIGNNKIINVTMYLNGLDAYNNNVITVTAIDTLTGCTITLTDNLTKLSPCNDLLINIDNTVNTLTYKATVINGKEPYTYKWIYNTNNFEAIGNTISDTLNLRNINDVTPFDIGVEITDTNGCKKTKTVAYTSSCKPSIRNITTTNTCTTIEEVIYNKYTITLINDGCGDLVQELIPLDNSFIKSIKLISNNKYELVIDRSFTLNIKQFYVKNNLGYKSNNFGVSFNNTTDCTKPINCTATIANDKIITLGSILKESTTPIDVIGNDTDYDTFKFIAESPQILNSNTELNTKSGIATYSNGIIKHVFNTTGERNDVFIKWSISNKCGESIVKTLTIKTKNIIIPNVGNKQNKVIKGKTSTIIIDGVDNLSVIKNPTSGSTSSFNNVLTYNATDIGNYNFEVSPLLEGFTGNLFIVNYEVVSSGTAVDKDFCNLGLINLATYLRGASTGGTWYNVNNAIPINQSNQVNFTSAAVGTYKFQYIINAGNEQDITTLTFNKYSFKLNDIDIIAAQPGAFKVTIQHEGLLIEDIRSSTYILDGLSENINLDSETTATSFSFTIFAETIFNLTYSINTVCGNISINYVRPSIQLSTFEIVGKGILLNNPILIKTAQVIKNVSANVIGKGMLLTPVNVLVGNQVVCNNGMDVVFLLDYTASMGSEIDDIKAQITAIKNTIITESNNNYRLGLVIFDEDTSSTPDYGNLAAYTSLPSSQKIIEQGVYCVNSQIRYQYITAMESMSNNNGDSFTTQLNKLNTVNLPLGSGLAIPEPSDLALYHVSKTVNPITGSFRNDVAKLVILITDAVSSGNDDCNTSADLDYINNVLTPLFTANNLKLLLLSTSTQTQLMNLVTASSGVYVNSFNPATIISTIQNICVGN